MVACTLLSLFLLAAVLFLLWRDSVGHARYWQGQAESCQRRLYESWQQQWELLARIDRDDADWWKE